MNQTITITINGQPYTIVGDMAVTANGQAFPLEDQPQDRWGR